MNFGELEYECKYRKTMTLKYEYDKVALKATVCGVEDCGTDVVIPETVEYYKKVYKVTSIGDYVFRGCYCEGLKNVTIGNSVTSIGNEAFSCCYGLTSVQIGNSVRSIGESAFHACKGLTSVVIPNSVTSIGDYAFSGCTCLKSVVIGNSVTSIGEHAFYGCTELTNVVIPNSVTSIGRYAFFDCSRLTSVQIGNSVRSIGGCAFEFCYALTSVVIPNSVRSIGNSAFRNCSRLTSVVIPNSVTSIGNVAFSDCKGLTSIVVDGNNTKYDSRENCNAIIETETNTLILGCKNTVIPNSVTSIGGFAFSGCSGLTSIEIPNSVTSIGRYAFDGCKGLTSVQIPSSVEKIHECAFGEIPNLQVDIYNEEGEVLIHPNAFRGDAKINYLGKKKVKEDKTTKVAKTSNEANDKKEEQAPVIDLDKLIDAVVADGVITEKERSVILKKATAAGYDADEVEILLDGKLAEKQNAEKVVTKEPKKAPAKKEAAPVTEVVTPEEKSSEGGRNYSKYSVNGAGSYGKGRMVEAVVNKYVELNPKTTVQKLKEVFPERLQGSNFIKDSTETITDMKRYYESALPGGAKFYISNQWGTQTDAFMEYVNNNVDGITVTKL